MTFSSPSCYKHLFPASEITLSPGFYLPRNGIYLKQEKTQHMQPFTAIRHVVRRNTNSTQQIPYLKVKKKIPFQI